MTNKRKRRDKTNQVTLPGLNTREELFVRHYTAYNSETFQNGTKSYKMAFGTDRDNTAGTESCRLLKSPKIKSAIEERINQIFFKLDLTPDRLLSEMAALATANLTDFYDDDGNLKNPKKLPRYITAALKQVDIETVMVDGKPVSAVQKIYIHDKRAAQETLMKYYNMLQDRLIVMDGGRAPVSQDDKAKQTRQKMLEELRAEEEVEQVIEGAMKSE